MRGEISAETLERGRVVAVSPAGVVVECEPSARCAGCATCGGHSVARTRILCGRDCDLSEGDEVLVRLKPGGTVLSAALLFLFPLACFGAGIAAAYPLRRWAARAVPGEGLFFVGGAAGLALGLGTIVLIGRHRSRSGKNRPRIVGIAPPM